MSKIDQLIKERIQQTVRREIKKATEPVRTLARELGRDVRNLQRRVATLERSINPLVADATKQKAQLDVMPDELTGVRISGSLIKKLRKRLGITQTELANLLNVSLSTIGLWESGKIRPKKQKVASMVALRKLGRRDVQKILDEKKAPVPATPQKKTRKKVKKSKKTSKRAGKSKKTKKSKKSS